MTKIKKELTREHVVETLALLSNRLNKDEYTQVTSLMSMMFIGHTFELSEDGFEFINLAIEVRKESHNQRIEKMYEQKALQNKIVRLKPKKK